MLASMPECARVVNPAPTGLYRVQLTKVDILRQILTNFAMAMKRVCSASSLDVTFTKS